MTPTFSPDDAGAADFVPPKEFDFLLPRLFVQSFPDRELHWRFFGGAFSQPLNMGDRTNTLISLILRFLFSSISVYLFNPSYPSPSAGAFP